MHQMIESGWFFQDSPSSSLFLVFLVVACSMNSYTDGWVGQQLENKRIKCVINPLVIDVWISINCIFSVSDLNRRSIAWSCSTGKRLLQLAWTTDSRLSADWWSQIVTMDPDTSGEGPVVNPKSHALSRYFDPWASLLDTARLSKLASYHHGRLGALVDLRRTIFFSRWII
jgi:hypothetical protein